MKAKKKVVSILEREHYVFVIIVRGWYTTSITTKDTQIQNIVDWMLTKTKQWT